MVAILVLPAVIWLTVLLGVSIVPIIRARSLTVRILALDTVTLILIALLALFTELTDTPYYLDVALVLGLVSFVGVLAAARYQSEGTVL